MTGDCTEYPTRRGSKAGDWKSIFDLRKAAGQIHESISGAILDVGRPLYLCMENLTDEEPPMVRLGNARRSKPVKTELGR